MDDLISHPGLPPQKPEDGQLRASREDLTTKRVFTTGEVAVLCGLSQQTVIRCFDAGRITGFKVPGSRFRRIPREELLRFMRQNNLPMDSLTAGPLRSCVLVSADPRVHSAVAAVLSLGPTMPFDLTPAHTPFEGGLQIGTRRPDLLILDTSDLPDVHDLLASLRRLNSLAAMRIICVGEHPVVTLGSTAQPDDFVAKPTDPDAFITLFAPALAAATKRLFAPIS